MSSKMLPPIPNALNCNSRDLGSLDPYAFRKQFGRNKQLTAYQEISTLSSRTESLRQENDMMRSELYELVATQDTPYCQLKRALIEFDGKLAEREKEVVDIKKYYNGSSASSTPTFVEVDIHKDKQASFDLVATSLLVCNEQRSFFKANDLRRQNEELLALIEHQQESLKMVQARLHLYWQCQHQNSAKLMLDSLKRGQSPPELADAAPNQLMEQKMKIKLLSNELRQLVQQRKELTRDGKFKSRLKARAEKRRREMAIRIQKIVRGFLARLHSPLPKRPKPQHVVHEPPPRQVKPPRNIPTAAEPPQQPAQQQIEQPPPESQPEQKEPPQEAPPQEETPPQEGTTKTTESIQTDEEVKENPEGDQTEN